MSAYTQIIYQIVFSTKYRAPTLAKSGRDELFRFIWGVLKNKRCHLFRINGVEDHLHIVLSLHPAVSLASLVKDIKISSSVYIKEKGIFPDFGGWQEGYGAFTYTIKEKNALIEYVKNQEAHHQETKSRDEFVLLLRQHGIIFDEKNI
jgi:REP element-mobilizing transposase RayT